MTGSRRHGLSRARSNGDSFRLYVEKVLLSTLRPGDIVVMDNLGSHRGKVVRQFIRSAGAKLFFLPKYSPDLNPIAFCRRGEQRGKQFFLQGEIDGVPVRWLVLRSTDGAVTWLNEHLVQEVVSSTWATTTFSDLEVKEATDPMPNVGAEPPAYTVTLGSGTLIVGYAVKSRLGFF